MGIYLNPGYENFRRTLAAPIYVDKTMMLHELNRAIDEGNNFLCISRPRRFGKTVAGNMISAYYSRGCDTRELFAGLKIAEAEDFEKNLNRFNVIKIDLNSEYQNVENKNDLFKRIQTKIRREAVKQYPDLEIYEEDTLADMILGIYEHTGEPFVIIVDEYDVLVREEVPEALFQKYLSFLNGLFKSDTVRPAIALAYLTGILPIVRDKIQSKLNNFREYTILNARNMTEYIGFTAEEVMALCKEYGMDYEECKSWYDGYTQNGYELYNPESVVMCMEDRQYDGFWSRTSTYLAISDRLQENFEGIRDAVVRMLAGESVDVNVSRYTNTMTGFKNRSDVFTYLCHIGYLAYDREEKTCRIPNKEVRLEWFNAIEDGEEYRQTDKIIKASKELLKETIRGNEAAVAKALDESHIHVTSNRSYNNEDALQSAIYLAYIYAINKYFIFREVTAGRGFADVIFVPVKGGRADTPAMVVELKRNDCTESAIEQIKKKEYFKALDGYEGTLLFVGINYDEKEKTHSAKIETFEM